MLLMQDALSGLKLLKLCLVSKSYQRWMEEGCHAAPDVEECWTQLFKVKHPEDVKNVSCQKLALVRMWQNS